jgi:hypothetical protein
MARPQKITLGEMRASGGLCVARALPELEGERLFVRRPRTY